jgi:Holliday junction DNA helicase RuvA
MIAKLTGTLDSLGEESAVIDVGGVGYLVFCSARTARQLPGRGEAAQLYVETHVREDHIHLYGFIDETERGWFRLLTTVQGVGARVALAVLGALAPDRLQQAILAQDAVALTQAEGVGRKLGARIVNALRDKVGGLGAPAAGAPAMGSEAAPAEVANGAAGDAVSALVNLGYARLDAFAAVGGAIRKLGPGASIDALIRGALKELAK